MPLMQGKSPKAFSKNVKTEMEHGKPQDQALAIAYSIKRKSKKKMAEGGTAYKNDSAVTEARPMPSERDNDAHQVSRNSAMKAPKNDQWLDQPTVKQAQDNNGRKVMPIKHPKMVPQSGYTTRLRSEEDDLQEYMRTGPYGEQPPKHDDEEGPDRQGSAVRDMEDEHSTHKKPYAKGGEIEASDARSHNQFKRTDQEPKDTGIEDEERTEEADLQSGASPSEDEGASLADILDEDGEDRQGPEVLDMEHEHSNGRKPYHMGGYAEGGEAEEELEHAASIAAAVMAKMKAEGRLHSGSEDEDEAVMAAEGGEMLPKHPTKILSHDSIYSDDSDQVDLDRNAEEDANEEDQTSFNALRKENYSEDDGLDALDQPHDSNEHADSREIDSENEHDQSMVSKIMRKMKARSPITR